MGCDFIDCEHAGDILQGNRAEVTDRVAAVERAFTGQLAIMVIRGRTER